LSNHEPSAVVFGCQGPTLTDWESGFFRDADPLGFILFARNCQTPDQVRALVGGLRDVVGRADAPVLIDQEGGRVARLRPPHWRQYPAAAEIGRLGGERAREAAFLAARLIADDLQALGITVDCLPVLDVPVPGADPVIGDRAYGTEPRLVAQLGRAACEGLLSGAVLPVIKHIPGHGRPTVDSHVALPVVAADRPTLAASDFATFRALADMPWAMTAHIVYRALDPALPATLSRRIIGEIIRGEIGFDGVLISDDLSMQALGGGLGERARAALAAGCDLALHCNGDQREMAEIAGAVAPLSHAASRRIARGEAMRRRAPEAFDRAATTARLDALMAGEAA
jgi:beta-N-acetylhexosaminidase